MSKYLETGKIVGTFGINGELKVLSDSTTNRFVKGNFLYLGKNTKALEKVEITSTRFHKGLYLVTINNLEDINLVLKYVGMTFYIDREELDDLKENEYYFDDLIGLKVIYNNEEVGMVKDVLDLPAAPALEIIINKIKKQILVPFVGKYFGKVTKEEIEMFNLEEFVDEI